MDTFSLFMCQTRKLRLLDGFEEECRLAKAIEAGLYARNLIDSGDTGGVPEEDLLEIERQGTEAFNTFVESNIPLAICVATKFSRARQHLPKEDIVQYGIEGLIRAVQKFDYTKGFKFSTYATIWIRQAIARGIPKLEWTVKRPTWLAVASSKIRGIESDLLVSLGRAPTEAEIAEAASMSIEKVRTALLYRDVDLSLDYALEDSEESEFIAEHLLRASSVEDETEEICSDVDFREAVRSVFAEMKSSHRKVIEERYGLIDGVCKSHRVAAKSAGVAHGTVENVERAFFSKMRERLGVSG